MAIATGLGKENAADGYASGATYVSLHTADPGTTGLSEVSGGSYARAATSGWSSDGTDDGIRTVVVTFSVPAGTTVTYVGLWTASTGGSFLDKAAVSSQAFASAGTYQVTLTYTQA